MRTTPQFSTESREALAARCTAMLDLCDAENRALTATEQDEYDQLTTKLRAFNLNKETGRPVFSDQPSNSFDDEGNFAGTQPRIVMQHTGRLQAYQNNAKGRAAAHTAGRFLAATFMQHSPSMKWCETNGIRFNPMAALSGGINTNGGALVPEEMSSTIIELTESYGVFRQNADNVPMGSDTLTIPRRVGGLTAYYTGENTEGTESDATWDNVTFTAKKLMCFSRMSSEVTEDAIINLGDRMTKEIGLAFATKEDTVGFTGDGTSTSGGITGVLVKAIDASHTKAKVAAASTHDTLAEINSTDVLNLMAAIPTYAKKGAKFYCSPTALSLVFDALLIAGGGNTMQSLANAAQPSFLGYPIVVTPVMADSASTTYNGAVMIAFGNLAQAATIATRRDVRVAMSDQRYFELDQIAIKGTLRHDIIAHDLGSTTVKSPFAVLVGTT
jgi:HK97 family phage major capsid protein